MTTQHTEQSEREELIAAYYHMMNEEELRVWARKAFAMLSTDAKPVQDFELAIFTSRVADLLHLMSPWIQMGLALPEGDKTHLMRAYDDVKRMLASSPALLAKDKPAKYIIEAEWPDRFAVPLEVTDVHYLGGGKIGIRVKPHASREAILCSDAKPVVDGEFEDRVYETIIPWDEGGGKRSRRELARRIVALLAATPAREWVGLTDDEIDTVGERVSDYDDPEYFRVMSRAIESKLREKNAATPAAGGSRTWCEYVAGMICTYLNEPPDSKLVDAIAGIIERRLWALKSTPAAGGGEPVAWGIFYKYAPDCVRLISVRLTEEKALQYTAFATGRSNMTIAPLYTHPQPSALPDEVVKDAERYRWLRGTTAYQNGLDIDLMRATPSEWYALIDAAMLKEGK